MLRTEYPRPQFERKEWLNLNGAWSFEFDDDNKALKDHWEKRNYVLSKTIQVPFCFESTLSGIHDTSIHNRCFYKREFQIPKDWLDKTILLNFGAVDYYCKIFVNEHMCFEHTGGSVGFSVDITNYLDKLSENQLLAVYVEDPATDESIPRGKQFWQEKSERIWYTRTSGIWQTVWLEPVAPYHISRIKLTPDIDCGEIHIETELQDFYHNSYLEITIQYESEIICHDQYSVSSNSVFKRSINIYGDKIFHTGAHGGKRNWTPENPVLYDISLKLKIGDRVCDEIISYFGMRKIHTENGMTYLNNHPYYFKLVLDQGYWPDGILTAPDDSAFQYDIKVMKEMGFNGCRKHQKVEDPRFLYWADKLGFLVWGEAPAACIYTDNTAINYINEWNEIIKRDYNHPCLVAWVPFNESWAIPNIKSNITEQSHTLSLYYFIKSLDQTRLVINNDGWEMTKTDICAIHNYTHGNESETQKRDYFKRFLSEKNILLSSYSAGKNIFADGFHYEGQPIIITECGGINYKSELESSWGYSSALSEEEFCSQYRYVIENILKSELIFGYCYTQLSDVEQETNGLLTFDRKIKCKPALIKEINEMFHPNVTLL
ncbi:MAG: glycoside hydrolase family 2 [Anaerocolumna sp.]|jgi:beta-galactosidase/beta-glucuronidase|nr:glycoside hydrolase family 2 [Anaerocolumna sp.]